MMPSICFLHNSAPYTGDTAKAPLRGTEGAVTRLAEELARRGHSVAVYNGVTEASEIKGVRWLPLVERFNATPHAAISINKSRLFNGMAAPVKILWSHNIVTLSRLIKKDGILSILRHRPDLIVLGDYHASQISRLLPFRSRRIMYHGVDVPAEARRCAVDVPPPRAVFTSAPYRGAAWVASVWPDLHVLVPEAELHIYSSAVREIDPARIPDSIKLRTSVPRHVLLQELGSARVLLLPGHRDETFCMAAAEATALGVPIVTLGAGSLSERVKHGVTGFIAKNRDEFVSYACSVLNDDRLWRRLNKNCIEDTSLIGWDKCAEAWEQAFFPGSGQPAGLTAAPAPAPGLQQPFALTTESVSAP